jgi:hypothetical protein
VFRFRQFLDFDNKSINFRIKSKAGNLTELSFDAMIADAAAAAQTQKDTGQNQNISF